MWNFLNSFRRSMNTPSRVNREPPVFTNTRPYVLLYRNQFGCLITAPGFNEYYNLNDATAAAKKLNIELRTSVYVMRTAEFIGEEEGR